MKEELKNRASGLLYAVVASYDTDSSFNGSRSLKSQKQVRGKSDVKNQIDQIIAMYEAGGAGMVYHSMSEEDIGKYHGGSPSR